MSRVRMSEDSVQKRLMLVCESSLCSRQAAGYKQTQPRIGKTLHSDFGEASLASDDVPHS